jgi:adenine deaminase
MGGGLSAVSERKVLASLSLPIAGLMAEDSVREVRDRLDVLITAAKDLGCKLPDPFMTLSFLSLPVIPELKLTDKGLIDVNQFKIVSLFGED